jgi:hypothetical protein
MTATRAFRVTKNLEIYVKYKIREFNSGSRERKKHKRFRVVQP